MGCIYKITNLINGKIYIGQTCMSEPQRWQQHIWCADNNPNNDSPHLCHAIKKYGRANFKREILEEIDDKDTLNDREIFYISLFHTTDPTIGYNIAMGGDGYYKFTSEEILKLYNQYKSITKVANILDAHRSTITKRLKGMGVKTYDTTVLKFDLDGNLLDTYYSFTDARNKTNLPLPHIIPKTHFSCGYIWVYEIEDNDIHSIIQNVKHSKTIHKSIQQYDLNCNFINEFKSAAEASRVLNIDVSSIKSAGRKDGQITAGGYIWFRPAGPEQLEDKYIRYLLSNQCCEIEEIDENGNTIKVYPSATIAEKELQWSYNSIKRVCDYKTTHIHNRFFQYTNKDKRILLQELKKEI